MSRIANAPVDLPKSVEVTLQGVDLKVKGPKGAMELRLHDAVEVESGPERVVGPKKMGQLLDDAMKDKLRAMITARAEARAAGAG